MASISEKQAELFRKIAVGEPVDQKRYGHITVEGARKAHAEDLAAGRFFDQAGRPRYDVLKPLSKSEMEEDAK